MVEPRLDRSSPRLSRINRTGPTIAAPPAADFPSAFVPTHEWLDTEGHLNNARRANQVRNSRERKMRHTILRRSLVIFFARHLRSPCGGILSLARRLDRLQRFAEQAALLAHEAQMMLQMHDHRLEQVGQRQTAALVVLSRAIERFGRQAA